MQSIFFKGFILHSSSPLQKDREKNATQPEQATEVWDEYKSKEQVTEPSSCKHSARLRTKKIKLLGLVEDTLTMVDILFINSLTPTQIKDMGKQCGLPTETEDQPSSIEKLKAMEAQWCGGIVK